MPMHYYQNDANTHRQRTLAVNDHSKCRELIVCRLYASPFLSLRERDAVCNIIEISATNGNALSMRGLISTCHSLRAASLDNEAYFTAPAMTIWKGPPGSVVRRPGPPQVAYRESTAVNISSVQAGSVTDMVRCATEPRCQSRTQSQDVVSTSLRRDRDVSTVTSVATKTTRIRNVNTDGMKRVLESWNTIKSKRSKCSNEYDENIKQKEGSVKSLIEKMPSTKMEVLPQNIDLPLAVENSVASDSECPEPDSDLITPIAVYTPTTSMNSLRHSTQVTSLDHFRSSTRIGNSDYFNSPQPDLQQIGVEYSRPWLNAVATQQGSTVFHSSQALVSSQPTFSANTVQHSPLAKPYIAQQPLGHDKSRTLVIDKPVNEVDPYSDDQLDEEAVLIAASIATKVPLGTTYESSRRLPSIGHQTILHSPISSSAPVYEYNEQAAVAISEHGSDEYGLDEIHEEIARQLMAQGRCQSNQEEAFPRLRTAKQNIRQVDADMHCDGARLSRSERQLLDPWASGTLRAGHGPIARSPFPNSVPDRSPLFGVCNSTLLRTCFRIGEALNIGCQAVRQNKSVIVELHARVTKSWRENVPGRQQHFEFRDLYHHHPPVLHGTFSLWKQLKPWDLDSEPFVRATEGGILCRVIGIMRRNGEGWRLEVLRIWETSWDDVEHVSGIYKRDA
nr:hypothetical protein CFP56_13270 [Quercus suber]